MKLTWKIIAHTINKILSKFKRTLLMRAWMYKIMSNFFAECMLLLLPHTWLWVLYKVQGFIWLVILMAEWHGAGTPVRMFWLYDSRWWRSRKWINHKQTRSSTCTATGSITRSCETAISAFQGDALVFNYHSWEHISSSFHHLKYYFTEGQASNAWTFGEQTTSKPRQLLYK